MIIKENIQKAERQWEAIFQRLLTNIKSEGWLVRGTAAAGLGGSDDPRAVEPLKELLLRDKIPFVRKSAAEALGELGGGTAEEALLEARVLEKDPTVLNAIRNSLENMRSEEPINRYRRISKELAALNDSAPRKKLKPRKKMTN